MTSALAVLDENVDYASNTALGTEELDARLKLETSPDTLVTYL
jgi:hypothetical protein